MAGSSPRTVHRGHGPSECTVQMTCTKRGQGRQFMNSLEYDLEGRPPGQGTPRLDPKRQCQSPSSSYHYTVGAVRVAELHLLRTRRALEVTTLVVYCIVPYYPTIHSVQCRTPRPAPGVPGLAETHPGSSHKTRSRFCAAPPGDVGALRKEKSTALENPAKGLVGPLQLNRTRHWPTFTFHVIGGLLVPRTPPLPLSQTQF